MKHLRLTILLMAATGVVGIGACSSSSDSTATSTAPPTTAKAQATTTEAAPEQEDDAATSELDTESSTIADFPEYGVIKGNIADLDTLTVIIETDNPNSRVILFKNADGRAVYKSVFTKRTNHEKVLDLNGGPPLFNDNL